MTPQRCPDEVVARPHAPHARTRPSPTAPTDTADPRWWSAWHTAPRGRGLARPLRGRDNLAAMRRVPCLLSTLGALLSACGGDDNREPTSTAVTVTQGTVTVTASATEPTTGGSGVTDPTGGTGATAAPAA